MRYLADDRATFEGIVDTCHRMLKAHGFDYKRTIQSAMYERRYQCLRTMRTVSIDGWHGTGTGSRNYGDGFNIHTLWLSHNARFAYDGKTLVNGEQETVDVGDRAESIGYYDFQGNRCLYTSDEVRERVLKDARSLPAKLEAWLKKTA